MNLAELIPHGSNVYDACIVLIVSVLSYLQLQTRLRQKRMSKAVSNTAAKAIATQEALVPEHQVEEVRQREKKLLRNGDAIHAILKHDGPRPSRKGLRDDSRKKK